MKSFDVVAITDPAVIARFIAESWHADYLASRGERIEATLLSAAIAERQGQIIGMITWRVDGADMEIVTLNSLEPGAGIGSALLQHAVGHARALGLRRAWLMTTNDNIEALKFYQKRGMVLCALHVNAMEENRRVKPEIPSIGDHGIPIRDELELERVLS